MEILSKVKYFLKYNTMYTLNCVVVLPYLNYGIEVWGNTIGKIHTAEFYEHTSILICKLK